MAEPSLVQRVEKLEKTVESLAELPAEVRRLGRRLVRVESRLGAVELQLLQHSAEMKGEFSAVRRELTQTRNDLLQVIDSSSQATQGMFDDLSKGMSRLADQMRSQHGDVIKHLSRLSDGGFRPPSGPAQTR